MNDLDFGIPFSGDFEEMFAFDLGLPGDLLELIFAVPRSFLNLAVNLSFSFFSLPP
jgi:hypothetical protein